MPNGDLGTFVWTGTEWSFVVELTMGREVRAGSSLRSQACVAEGWVLVNKEGRITLLGGLDIGKE